MLAKATRPLLPIVAGLLLLCPLSIRAKAQDPPPLPLRIDVGSDHATQDHAGRLFLPDQAWTPETQAGYIGGYRVWTSEMHPVDGTLDAALHQNQRHGWSEYRLSAIPNGDYLVTLSFSEIGIPAYTVFDVSIEGQTVLDDFRISDEVGGNYELVRRFPARVDDGELTIAAAPIAGEPRLSAIQIETRAPDATPPAAPADLTTTSSYHAVLLDWTDAAEDDLDGYYVYRAVSPQGPYRRRTRQPVHVSHYRDPVSVPHLPYQYCISSVDVYGNEGALSCQPGSGLDVREATLPLYELDVPPNNLLDLAQHVLSDQEVTATLTYAGQRFPVTVRYRGGVGRYFHKKSWKINFPISSPFPGQDQINLRADYPDRSLMRTKLATTLFEAVGVPVPRAEHVLLMLNGEYQGVYTYNEQVDEGFLARTGRHPDTSIYKAIATELNDYSRAQPSEQAYRDAFEKKTNRDQDYGDLTALIQLINQTPDEQFAHELGRVFDVATYLDYYAIIVLTSNSDFVRHNVYLLHDPTTDRWELVPYDLDAGFREAARPMDMGTVHSPLLSLEMNSRLLTRVLDVPQFRAYYCHRLSQFIGMVFSDLRLIDETYASIASDGLRDWQKRHREDNARFTAAPAELKGYVAARRDLLRREMQTYCPAPRPYLKINEVGNEGANEGTNGSVWFEVHNLGLTPAALTGLYLTDDLTDPTRFRIPRGVSVPPGGFITFFADHGYPWQGRFHTDFTLEASGGEIGIFDLDDEQWIDTVQFEELPTDGSVGRSPDGGDPWRSFHVATPGRANGPHAPVIAAPTHAPRLPAPSDIVAITAAITDDGRELTATLYYTVTGSSFSVSMLPLQRGDYTARIPPQPSGSRVAYTILARDADGRTSRARGEYVVDYQPPPLHISEVMADNATTLEDPDEPGEFPDWIELHNPGPTAVDLGGRYLSDDPNNPTQFRIPDGVTVPAGGLLLFYADNDPEQGPLHTTFKLSRGGENVGLFDRDWNDNEPLDVHTLGPQMTDVSEGRCLADPSAGWMLFPHPTPGAESGPCGGTRVTTVRRRPPIPAASDTVTVEAVVSTREASATLTLWYNADAAGFVARPMEPDGATRFRAAIPPQPHGATVAYYVHIENERGVTMTTPLRAPLDAYHYQVDYQPPPLFINELMADNARTLEDPDEPGEFPDWIELYNAGPVPIDLGGKYLTDDVSNPTQYRIPDGMTLPPGGFALFYADGEPEQGARHTNFRLNREGESVGLFDTDTTGNQPIDVRRFGWQATDMSESRQPDGGETWITSHAPSPTTEFTLRSDMPYLPTVLK